MIQREQNSIRVFPPIFLHFSAITLGLVVLLMGYGTASGATLFAGSASQVVYKGQTFVVDWYLDTEGSAINTIDLKISYPKDTLKVTEAGPGNSIVSLWLKQPKFDAQSGIIELTGGIPNGVNAQAIPIFRTTFEAISEGAVKISLESSSSILRNDGNGTSEALKFRPLEFSIVSESLQPNVITSSTHPDQSKWYQNNAVVVSFVSKEGTEYSYSFSSNAEIYPDDVLESASQVNYEDMPDGLYYFKVNSKVGPSTWQEAGVYRVQIDSTLPEKFQLVAGSDTEAFGGKSFLSFSTVDKTSGMSHYKARFGFGMWQEVTSPLKLKKPLVGRTISVAAYDIAGNKTVATIQYESLIPNWLWSIIVVIIIVSLAYIVRRKQIPKK